MSDAGTITAKELAILADTTPKRMRSFIRSMDERGDTLVAPVGSGARYSFSKDEAHAIIAAFKARSQHAGASPRRSAAELAAWLADDDEGDDEANALVEGDEGDEANA